MNSERLTEAMLSTEYNDNGFTMKTKEDAHEALRHRGFVMLNGVWRGKGGRTATIYKIRDSVVDGEGKVLRYVSKGFLVSFGGEPKSCYELKFTKIAKPRF